MRICHRWMQEQMTNRRGRSYPLRCTTSRDDWWIGRMAVMDRAATLPCAQSTSRITNHSTTDSVSYASFSVFSYHLTPFAVEWNIRTMPMSVAAVIDNNDCYTNYRFCHHPHFPRGCNFKRLIFVQHVICQINFAVISLILLGVPFCVSSNQWRNGEY
ncbi:uncharacterized protein TNCV_4288991 [Trichonephila clavipes]|nr:uncharacterized protein TNCV_4288991 [Trichonephila clavipes]